MSDGGGEHRYTVTPEMGCALIESLIADCPFIEPHIYPSERDLPTVVFGCAARLIADGSLKAVQEDRLFDHFNRLAESQDRHVLDILGVGAIEMFNDSAAIQRLARTKLTGHALLMLEEYRIAWGQPDYDEVPFKGSND